MKKFLLSCMALAAASFAADAQLYCTGDFEASKWSPKAPIEAELIDGAYTFEIDGVTSLKISTAIGVGEDDETAWASFNAGSLMIDGPAPSEAGTYPLTAGDSNIVLPWTGDWKIVVNEALTEVTISTTTPKPEGFPKAYIRGSAYGWEAPVEAQELTTTDGIKYTKDISDMEIIEGLSSNRWKIADATWGKINFEAENPIYVNEDPVVMLYNVGDQNMYIDWDGAKMEPIQIIFMYNGEEGSTIQVAPLAGVEKIIADQDVAPVYYNLQGVRVNEPANGLFIKVTGNKVAKVIR